MRFLREPPMISGRPRSSAVIDWMIASMRLNCFSSTAWPAVRASFKRLADTRQHLDQTRQTAAAGHLAQLDHLIEKVLQVELALDDLRLHLGRLLLVDVLLGALDQAQHVAHAQDALGDAIGVELFERVELLAGRRRT